MEHREILEHILFKAHKNGMRPLEIEKEFFVNWTPIYKTDPVQFFPKLSEGGYTNLSNVYKVIFSHDFARAIWGNEWEGFIQQMAISEDPIKYLEKFI